MRLIWLVAALQLGVCLGFYPSRLISSKFSLTLQAVHSDIIGQRFKVTGVRYRDDKYANLKVYGDCGDPYDEVLSYLRHGDEILAVGYKDFNGQTWIQHLVDENKQGLYKGDCPRDVYLGWSPQDISGSRWLQQIDNRSAGPRTGYDANNIFAKIIRGEVPSYKVFESKDSFAILDAFPVARFHCLLLPTRPSMDISDLSGADYGFLQDLPRLVAAVKQASGAPAVKVFTNAGFEAGQRVFHTHFHVVPCFDENSDFSSNSGILCPMEAEETLRKIHDALQNRETSGEMR
jgi:histidine triad (HIT) family protein